MPGLCSTATARIGPDSSEHRSKGPELPRRCRRLTMLVVCHIPREVTPMVIVIDEAGNIENDQFRNSFYGQIRQMSSLHATASSTDVAARVRFIFSGTFRPETLVSEKNSPFNVCQTVYTDDLSIDQVLGLTHTINPLVEPYVQTAFDLVGGQPYLLQVLLREATRDMRILTPERFSRLMSDLPYLVSGHLEGIFSKIIGSPNLVHMISSMVQQGYAPLQPADSDCAFLQVLGVAKRDVPNSSSATDYTRILPQRPLS